MYPRRTHEAQAGGQSLSPSCLGNFIPFFTLSNYEIMHLIKNFGIVFHTTDAKKDLIVQNSKNMEFSKFTSFLECLISVLKSHCVV
jgi:hypothetical protein